MCVEAQWNFEYLPLYNAVSLSLFKVILYVGSKSQGAPLDKL